MPLHLTTSDPDFESAFAAFLAAKREVSEDVDAGRARHHRGGAPRRRHGAHRADAPLRPARPRRSRHPRQRGRDRRRRGGVRPETMAALELARARIESHHRRQLPRRRPLHRCARRRARLALDRDRVGRPLRPRRARQLSELRADERGAGPGRRRAARRHGRALAGRRDEPAGAGGRAPGRRLRDLSHRRRPGRGRARLRHRDRARRSPRSSAPATPTSPPPSARCSAPSASTPSPARPRCWSSPTGDNDPEWLAADLLAQAEHDTAAQAILMTDDAGLRPSAVEAAVARQLGGPAARQHRRRQLGDVRRRHRAALARRGAAARRPHRRRARRDRHRATRKASPHASATPAPSSSARTRRK